MEDDWILTYSNLMTILLVFFMTLYVFSNLVGEENYERIISSLQIEMGGKPDLERIQRIKIRKDEEQIGVFLNAFIGTKGLKKFAQVKTEKTKINIFFAEPLVFDSGSAEIKPESIYILEKLAEILKNIPNEVIVEGHTDDVPPSKNSIFKSNWELSLARTFSIVHYFVDIENLSGKRFTPLGYGEFRPLVKNDTEENRNKNRRIEISILRTE